MLNVLDLFCGMGGLSLGFLRAGCRVTAVDISEHACRTLAHNLKYSSSVKIISADLNKELMNGRYDVIVGGPPCKPWSTVNLIKRKTRHPDYGLTARFFEHVIYNLPSIFMMENVIPLRNDAMLMQYLKRLRKLNYSISLQIVRYSDYGAATSRRRLVIFGSRTSNGSFFCRTLDKYRRSALTVKDMIWHLRDIDRGSAPDHEWPELRTIYKYRDYYMDGKYGWYVLQWDRPAPSFGNVMKTYILHPDSFNGRETRVISVRESLLIMGFPNEFEFPEKMGLGVRYQMIADAVSPVFSYAAAKAIEHMLVDGSKTR